MWVGCECGPYLAADMTRLLSNLEANGELVPGHGGYSPEVRAELETMSGATIDRYLAGFKATHGIRGFTTLRGLSAPRRTLLLWGVRRRCSGRGWASLV